MGQVPLPQRQRRQDSDLWRVQRVAADFTGSESHSLCGWDPRRRLAACPAPFFGALQRFTAPLGCKFFDESGVSEA